MAGEPYRELDHTADVALIAYGRDMAELLRNAADGMIALAGIETDSGPRCARRFQLSAPDAESLLVTWLEEILSQAEAEHTLLEGYTLRMNDSTQLEVEGASAPIRRVAKEIKAVTFHGLQVRKTHTGLEATIVFDV